MPTRLKAVIAIFTAGIAFLGAVVAVYEAVKDK
jgi:hypothetical protein